MDFLNYPFLEMNIEDNAPLYMIQEYKLGIIPNCNKPNKIIIS
jgi:hypothetical protein